MADALAQQISVLLDMDAENLAVTLDTLIMRAAKPSLAAPPGLDLGLGLEIQQIPQSAFLKKEEEEEEESVSRVSTTDSVLLSDGGSTCFGSRTPPGLGSLDSSTICGDSSDCSDTVSCDDRAEKSEERREVLTMKIKNLPRRSTQEEILEAVNGAGFAGTYDFFFLPLGGQKSRQNRGYAFINFTDVVNASRFRAAFRRYQLREKAVEVVAAPVQGLTQNVEHYGRLCEEAGMGSAKAVMLLH